MSRVILSSLFTLVRMSFENSFSFIEYLRGFRGNETEASGGASFGFSSASGSNEDTLTLNGFSGAPPTNGSLNDCLGGAADWQWLMFRFIFMLGLWN